MAVAVESCIVMSGSFAVSHPFVASLTTPILGGRLAMIPRPANYYPYPAPTYPPLTPNVSLFPTNSLIRHRHVPSSLDPRLIYAAQPSGPSRLFPRCQEPSLIPYPSTPLSRPKHFSQPLFRFPSYLSTNSLYPRLCPISSPTPSRNIHGERVSAGIHQRKDSIQHYSVHQHPLIRFRLLIEKRRSLKVRR
jgi:hypothetical protein